VLSIFRTNQLVFSLLIIPYLILIRISSFTDPIIGSVEGAGLFSKFIYQIAPLNSYVSHITALVLIFIQSLIINMACSRYKIFDEPNQLGGLFYALLCSLIPDFLWLSPVLMANTFLLIAMIELFEIYDKKSGASTIFNIGFFIGLASLFYISALVLLIFVLIGLSIQRSFSLKEILMVVIGVIVPYYLLLTYYYWSDNLGYFYSMQIESGIKLFQFSMPQDFSSLFKVVLVLIMILIFIFNFNNLSLKRNIQVTKIQQLLYWWLLIMPLGLMVQAKVQLDFLLILMLPCSILLTYIFLGMKKQWADALHIIIVTFVVVFQYIKYLL
jgi:hypothetical protein